MKKIVLLGLLLNCSLMVYAMDENPLDKNPLILLQEGYKLISVVQGSQPVVPVVDSKPRRDFRLEDNVVLGSVYGVSKNDGRWEYKLGLGLQRDILHDLEDRYPRLPEEKKVSCIFSTEKRMWGNIFENLDQNQHFYILLEGKNKETQKEEYVALNITCRIFSVFTIEAEDLSKLQKELQEAEIFVPSPQTIEKQPQTKELEELNPSHDSAPKIKISMGTAMGGFAIFSALLIFLYNMDYLPTTLSQILSNMQAKLAGIVSFTFSRRFNRAFY